MIRILIIDDHPLVQDGLAVMLRDEVSLQIAGACKTAEEALAFLAGNEPDIILLDINLPDMDGLTLCEKIREKYKKAKIIGLTSGNEAGIITGLLQRGANGYLLKNMERDELLKAIEKVQAGKVYVSEAANEKLLEHFRGAELRGDVPVLTRREKEILQLLADGLNGPEIAEKLFLSAFTIETHRKNLFKKFNVHSVQSLLKIAREHKLLP
ncbi:MAG: response regulator transcription factor [Cyclobacteriaceae bacterium]|nr:response regulator transcription factor [Cyclobacteriaceae bacterium]